MAGRSNPVRTCVGCRVRASRAELLRVVLAEADGVITVVPDERGRLPGRGASLHPDPRCLDLAERRRAFPRAFRLPGPLDTAPVRRLLEARAAAPAGPVDAPPARPAHEARRAVPLSPPQSEAGREA